MLRYPRLAIDLSVEFPFAQGNAVFYTSIVRAKVRKGCVRQCWISETQLKRVREDLACDWLEEGDLFARDIDGLAWKIIVDRPRKR